MARSRTGNKPLHELMFTQFTDAHMWPQRANRVKCWSRSQSPSGVTGSQWVNVLLSLVSLSWYCYIAICHCFCIYVYVWQLREKLLEFWIKSDTNTVVSSYRCLKLPGLCYVLPVCIVSITVEWESLEFRTSLFRTCWKKSTLYIADWLVELNTSVPLALTMMPIGVIP